MDDQDHTETYRGHEIKVEVLEYPPGRWSYSYWVDGRTTARGRIAHETAEAAMRQGINAARARVDGMGG